MGGRAEFLELLAGEDVHGNEMDLGVTVLAGLGGGHVDDLAGAVLDHDEAVLAEGRALHGESGRRAGVNRLEGVIMLDRERQWSATLYKSGGYTVSTGDMIASPEASPLKSLHFAFCCVHGDAIISRPRLVGLERNAG